MGIVPTAISDSVIYFPRNQLRFFGGGSQSINPKLRKGKYGNENTKINRTLRCDSPARWFFSSRSGFKYQHNRTHSAASEKNRCSRAKSSRLGAASILPNQRRSTNS